nr:hypothetical protein [Tanacetum cinerariifolium]
SVYWVSASMLPVLGTVYDSLDECIEIYRTYASKAGFDLKKNDRQVRSSNFRVCGCKARVVFDMLFIIKVANANIGAVRAHSLYTGLKGSSSFVHGTQTEFKNFTRGVNCFIGDSDAQMLITRMKQRQEFTKDFSFDYFVEDAELCGLFWADEVAKYNYKEFGDIVSFDATYKTNKYKMVFVPFTAIDNHRKSVTVGSGLLKKETAEAYGLLLRAFKKAFVRPPNIVVIDQDGAMRLAVLVPKVVLPCLTKRIMYHGRLVFSGDTNREVPVNETFHVQTDDELTQKELKQIETNDQAIQTILLGLPEDIYAAVDSCETAQEIWLREVDELKAERLAKTQDPLALMATSNNPYNFPVLNQDQPSFNQNYMQQPMPNHEDITDPTTAMNNSLTLMAKAFKLNYSTLTNNNQRISSNPRNRQIAQPTMNICQDRQMQMVGVHNVRNQVAQNLRVQNVRNQNGLIGVPGNANQNLNGNGNLVAARAEGNATGHNGNQIRCYNCRGVCHFARNCTVRPKRRDTAYLQTQLLIAQKEEARIQLQDEEFDLMAAAADLDEIEEVNANRILMANL